MNIFISHTSALNFYRNARANNILEIVNNKGNNILGANIYTPEVNKWTLPLVNINVNNKTTHTYDVMKNTIPYLHEDEKIDILISRYTNQNKTTRVKYHLNRETLPPWSFIKVTKGIYVVCPELLFCQLAEILSLEQLFVLGMELCGSYTMQNGEITSFLSPVSQLTTANRINKYIYKIEKTHKHMRGISKARYIAKYLENGSASPQETKLFIMLTAPRKIGGYGLKNIKLNYPIKLSADSINILGYSKIRPDLSNPKTKLAIEYDSTMYHENENQNKKDKLRLDVFHNEGWTLISFVPALMKTRSSFHTLALRILKTNQQNTRITISDFTNRQMHLWKELKTNI